MLPAGLSASVQTWAIGLLGLAATVAAVTVCSWNRAARFRLVALYALAWFLVVLTQIARGTSPSRDFFWTGLAEWSGLLLVTAIIGWLIRRSHVAVAKRNSTDRNDWFMVAQALFMTATGSLVVWIAIDFSFDGEGEGSALFGFSGRSCACPSALMLLGASIVMAWQSTGSWRAAWQFAALVTGVLFTTSIGLVRIDAASDALWVERTAKLMLSTGMMTIMTWFGLPRVLPKGSDWILRGRQAAPIFAVAALFLLATRLMEKVFAGQP